MVFSTHFYSSADSFRRYFLYLFLFLFVFQSPLEYEGFLLTKGSDLAQNQRTPAMTPPPSDPAMQPSMLDPSPKKGEAEEPHASPSLPIHDVAEGRTTPASASARSQSQSSSDSQADEDVVMQNLTGTRHAFYYGI